MDIRDQRLEDLGESSTEAMIEFLPFFFSNKDILLKQHRYALIAFAIIYLCTGKAMEYSVNCCSIFCLGMLQAISICGVQFVIFSSVIPPSI